MSARPTSIRIPDETRAAIEETCRRTGRDFSSVANEMLAEAVKMRRIPGIAFADGAIGRIARIAGTGVEVFEVAKTHREVGGDLARLRAAYHWLSEQQLRAALAYAQAYPEEIAEQLSEEDRWMPEEVWGRYPFTAPGDAAGGPPEHL
jgi:uncharacterized protein (DUF433 family)